MLLTFAHTVVLTCTLLPLPSHWSHSPDSCPCSLPAPGHSRRSLYKYSHTSHLQGLLIPSVTGILKNTHTWAYAWGLTHILHLMFHFMAWTDKHKQNKASFSLIKSSILFLEPWNQLEASPSGDLLTWLQTDISGCRMWSRCSHGGTVLTAAANTILPHGVQGSGQSHLQI